MQNFQELIVLLGVLLGAGMIIYAILFRVSKKDNESPERKRDRLLGRK